MLFGGVSAGATGGNSGGGGLPTIGVIKSADEFRGGGGIVRPDTELTITLAANTLYRFESFIMYTTGGKGFRLSYASSLAIETRSVGPSGGASNVMIGPNVVNGPGQLQVSNTVSSELGEFQTGFCVTGDQPVTITIHWDSYNATAVQSEKARIRRGSFLTFMKIADA